jgi:hypothetical protein
MIKKGRARFRRSIKDFWSGADQGSMVIALMVTVMIGILSVTVVSVVSVVAWQVGQNNIETKNRRAVWAVDNAIAKASDTIGGKNQVLVNLPVVEPSTWSAGTDSDTFYRWWVVESDNAVAQSVAIPAAGFSAVNYGGGIWVAVTSAGTAYTSNDGLSWTIRNALPSAGSITYDKITYGLGQYVATSSNSTATIATSSDGINWNAKTLPTPSWQS